MQHLQSTLFTYFELFQKTFGKSQHNAMFLVMNLFYYGDSSLLKTKCILALLNVAWQYLYCFSHPFLFLVDGVHTWNVFHVGYSEWEGSAVFSVKTRHYEYCYVHAVLFLHGEIRFLLLRWWRYFPLNHCQVCWEIVALGKTNKKWINRSSRRRCFIVY